MKNLLLFGATTLLLSSCATTGSDCISKSLAGEKPVNFGSDEAKAAYNALPSFYLGQDQMEKARDAVEQTTKAIGTYDLSPEAETLFLRTRIAANRKLMDAKAVRSDTERLVALDRLNKNEGPYLLAQLNKSLETKPDDLQRDAQPLVRIPSILPKAALDIGKSGHCLLEFDVSATGTPENITTGYCTDDMFRENSIKSVSRWKYNPALKDGVAVQRKNVVTTIKYRLMDSCGTILPE